MLGGASVDVIFSQPRHLIYFQSVEENLFACAKVEIKLGKFDLGSLIEITLSCELCFSAPEAK